MDKVKIFLLAQTAICVLSALLLAGAAIGIYHEGTIRKARDPEAYIYTRADALNVAAPGAALMIVGLSLSAIGGVLGIRDEKADRPVTDKDCMRSSGAENGKAISDEKLRKSRLMVLTIAIFCIIAGIINGNMSSILVKAINICTECIGLG
ncbi:MAG: hypothetical protein J6P05_06145 [Lachnospiraceae bacterium]|nr:hypothetical protein [Lachnospiraceae bacterium]